MVVEIDGNNLTVEEVYRVAVENERVVLAETAKKNVKKCADFLKKYVAVAKQPVYGVTTGVGELVKKDIAEKNLRELQRKIVLSHMSSVGRIVDREDVRAAMLCRANVLAKGYSGVRLETLSTLIAMLNKNITPVVYEKGSVGTSGDLTMLSHIAAVLIGEGKAFADGKLLDARTALKAAGIQPVKLDLKEGLALINGSQMFTGAGALLVYNAAKIVKTAEIVFGLTFEALRGSIENFDARIHEVANFPCQARVASNMLKLVAGSELVRKKSERQDCYSLRCIPRILGPVVDLIDYTQTQIKRELNSAADNPLLFAEEGLCLTSCNFHGQPVALPLDTLAIAFSTVTNLCERHINRLLNAHLSGLPDFLIYSKSGLNTGLMVAHYTAADLTAENKVLSHPASIHSVSVSEDQEDYVCMGPAAVRKAKEALRNLVYAIAIELLCAAQALEFQKGKCGKGTDIVYKLIRKNVPPLTEDRPLSPDIEKIAHLITTHKILTEVEKGIGRLA